MADVGTILSDKHVSVDANDTLTSLIGALTQHDSREAIVFDGEEYVGMFAHARIPKPRMNTTEIKIRTLTEPAPTLTRSDSILTAAQRMFESGHMMLPVIEKSFLGVVHVADVLKHLRDIPETRGVHVADIRHPQPVTLRYDDGIGKVFPLIRKQGIDHFPVTGPDGTITGFLTTRDLLKSYYSHPIHRDRGMAPRSIDTRGFQGEKPHLVQLPVENFMNKQQAITIAERDSLRTAIDTMLARNVHSLVLLRDDKPYGILTIRDVLEAIITVQTQELAVIQYKGLREINLGEREEGIVKKICAYHADKVRHHIDNTFNVIVHLKERSSTGRRHRYTASTRVVTPGGPVIATEAADWDVRTALHQAFGELETALEHHFKTRFTPSVKKLAARSDNDNLPGELSS